ncbi:A-kinase anchor protein 9-like [Notamacropus eugenii]|uniref:A-kinase anchor protein 9-like n=1 Tax=Notamacropus eugenii TaxID=9315 RepID=UPI003B6709DE
MGEVVAGPFSMLLIILPFSLPGRLVSIPRGPGRREWGGGERARHAAGGLGGGAWNAAGGSGGGALGAPARTLVHGDCANVLLPLLPPSASVFPWRRGWRLRRTRSSREPAWRVGAGPVAEHCGAQSRPTETSVSIRPFPSLSLPPCPSSFPAQAMEDEERQKKLIRGKALLAQYQLKKARAEAQNSSKQQKGKKKPSAKKCEESSHTSSIDQSQSDELYMTSSQRGASVTPDITRTLHTGEIIKHDQSYTIEMESEISTTTDDYSSEVNGCSLVQADIPTNLLMEEEFGVGESYSEQGAQFPSKQLEMMENELAGKQQEIEELNRELEEMRAAYGTEGFQQLQEFEAAIKQRDGIITQLTATLQQARREKDETMREFLEVTEQSQKLQIQFHHLQASQSLRNTNHSSTAAHLLQAKHQIVWQQQQLEQQHHLLEDHHKKKEEFKMQINFLQEKIGTYEMEMKEQKDSSKKELEEKDSVMEELKIKLVEEEENSVELKDKLIATDKLLGDFKEQIVEKDKEISNIRLELANSEQKERQRSGEIKQLMGTVEELQKKSRKESQLDTETVQRMEIQTQQKLEKLRVELDEMYGQQIVQMKQELIKQHLFELDELNAQHKGELENALKTCPDIPVNENQIQLMNMAITELNLKLQDAISQKEKISKELEIISRAKSILQSQLEDLFEELSFSREQVQRARQTIAEQEDELNEAHKLLSGVEDLKAQIVSASEFRKDLELKHEAEVSNYKIKLEMLEKEKNSVFDRMADSREAELERLRTQLLFSHEEELTRLREGLEIEHEMNIEKLKDNLSVHDKQQIEELQKEMSHEMESIQFEKDDLITKQNQLFLEISKLKDLQQSLVNSKSEEMTLQIKELQKEIEVLRQEEKEKGTLEQEVQELQLKTEFLERQIKEKEDDLQEKFTQLETEHTILKNEKKTLEDMLKIYSPISKEEGFIFIDSVKPKSEECEWQKKIDILLEENEKLTKQCTQLNEEIERQRNTYSFAEKNFETNYQELREEYAYLLKVRSDLEDSKSKQEVEYEMKLKALTDELYHLQKSKPVLLVKTKSADCESCKDDKSFTAEISEIGEVVEKDTTELMEKLEVTQQEKLELSERLSDLSEQFKQKHSEINHLSEEIKSLKQEKEQVLKRCKELEIIVGHSRAEHMDELKLKPCNFKNGIQTQGNKDSAAPVFKINKDFDEGAKIIEMNIRKESEQELVKPEKNSLLAPMDSVTDQLANESLASSLAIAQSGNDQLRQELSPLKSEQLSNENVRKEEMGIIKVSRKQPQEEEEEAKDGSEKQGVEEVQLCPEKLKECGPAVSPDSVTKDRNPLQEANNRLVKILLQVVKTIAAVEETAGPDVLGVLDPSYRVTSPANVLWETETEGRVQYYICKEEEPLVSCCGSGTPSNAPGTSSEITEEKKELCQHLLQCKLSGAKINLKSEELILNVSCRLQAVVEKLLEAVKGPNSQLEHAKVTQTELVCESFRRNKKTSKFLKFQEPVSEEQKAREHLDSELGRTEYIIGGEEEKALFEREFEEKGNLIDYLAEELLCVGRKLEELEEEKEQIEEERKLFSREIAIWKAEKLQAHQGLVDAAVDAAPEAAELLEETGRLAREKLEVQRQAEKVCGDLQKQVKALEIDVEEQVSRFKELEQEKTTEVMDLRQQNQFLEKQLEKMRKFLDEQAFDREHERDVFQQEIQKLEQKLKATPKFQPVSEDQTREDGYSSSRERVSSSET